MELASAAAKEKQHRRFWCKQHWRFWCNVHSRIPKVRAQKLRLQLENTKMKLRLENTKWELQLEIVQLQLENAKLQLGISTMRHDLQELQDFMLGALDSFGW